MARRYQITCVVRSDRLNHHQRLVAIGGVNPDGAHWRISEQAAIEAIESGGWEFYIARAGHEFAVEVAVSRYDTKYLRTPLDRRQPESLLALPECGSLARSPQPTGRGRR